MSATHEQSGSGVVHVQPAQHELHNLDAAPGQRQRQLEDECSLCAQSVGAEDGMMRGTNLVGEEGEVGCLRSGLGMHTRCSLVVPRGCISLLSLSHKVFEQ
jgi:hypothetical protein